jgi:disulfide bond formation protein DsbB
MKKRFFLYIAFTQALIATAGSLFLSLGLNWTPCVLCWYQRICMYPLVIILGAAILFEISNVEYIVLPLSIIGLLISIFHNLLQYRIIPESLAPCSTSASCTIPYHFFFGFLTIPLLSLLAFVVVVSSMLFYRKTQV